MILKTVKRCMLMYCMVFFSGVIYTDGYHHENRIIAGTPATRNQFPFIASICRKTIGAPKESRIIRRCAHVCGASIITSSWLLTANSCFDIFQTEFRAVAGILKPRERHKDIQVQDVLRIVRHKSYERHVETFEHNIALVKVVKPFKFTKAVNKIDLPRPYEHTEGSSSSYIPGYGAAQFYPKYALSHLRYLNSPIIPLKECRRILKENRLTRRIKILDSQICTYPQLNQTICEGDPGGPLVNMGTVVGIISYSIGSCFKQHKFRSPNVFTRVSTYLDYIHKKIKEH